MKYLENCELYNDESLIIIKKLASVSGENVVKHFEAKSDTPQSPKDATSMETVETDTNKEATAHMTGFPQDTLKVFHPQSLPANLFDFAILTKTAESEQKLIASFRHGAVLRTMHALVHGKVNLTTDDVRQELSWKFSVKEFVCESVHRSNNSEGQFLSLVRVKWCPNNPSQLKSIFKKLGHPVVGNGSNCKRLKPISDWKLKKSKGSSCRGTCMSTTGLEFPHTKTGKKLVFTHPIPSKLITIAEREDEYWRKTTLEREQQLRFNGIEEAKAKTLSKNRSNLSQLIGKSTFGKVNLILDKGVFAPRQSSYALVATALRCLKPHLDRIINAHCSENLEKECFSKSRINVLDLGCGSGCLLLAAVAEIADVIKKAGADSGKYRGQVYGLGLDINPRAVEVSRSNAKYNGLQGCCNFACVDYVKEGLLLPQSCNDSNNMERRNDENQIKFNVILANPPYLSAHITDDMTAVSDAPKLAVNGGSDGLDVYKRIAEMCIDKTKCGLLQHVYLSSRANCREDDNKKIVKRLRIDKNSVSNEEEESFLVLEVPGNDEIKASRILKLFEVPTLSFQGYGVLDGYKMRRCCYFKFVS
eukprot:CAMPEP_0204824132 /NCGR_PEP_ID=MMETSP1346-20131115/2180_1 /ASSEMBLY_ACC=CAM_ASM_000771 /TAXON_ID=215587 /ORGANISM="Aplanochytrium stocchinoi, Strain GSBS06" /LENGTH=588 /DNA_ID=CAMNT_0051951123 /DNA_START=451 /DNA_END=2217 /DNA_ORIENTATION=+